MTLPSYSIYDKGSFDFQIDRGARYPDWDTSLVVDFYDSDGVKQFSATTLSTPPLAKGVANNGNLYVYVEDIDLHGYAVGAVSAYIYAKSNGTKLKPYPTIVVAFSVVDQGEFEILPGTYLYNLMENIRTRFGDPRVCVELADKNYMVVTQTALRWLNARKGILLPYSFTANGGNEMNVLTEAQEAQVPRPFGLPSDCEKVVDALFYEAIEEFGYQDVLGEGYQFVGWTPDIDVHYSELIQWYEHREISRNVLNVNKEWEWDDVRRKLVMHRANSGEPVIVYYKKKLGLSLLLDADDIEELLGYVANLSPEIEEMFIEYAYATAMEILGRIRRKFDSIPAADRDVSLDGDLLLDEARTLKETINTRMAGLSEYGVIVG